MPSSVSVALCTYQGERFLAAQLDSIRAQTRSPDEVVAVDDGSTDTTLEQLHRFASRVPFPVHVHENPRRLGSTANFGEAMARCTGDLIMLCDQDDVWLPEKIERLAAEFDGPSPPALAFGDAEIIDETSTGDDRRLWERLGYAPSLQQRFRSGETVEVLCVGNVVTGATSAMRAQYRELVLPIPDGWVHDAWLAMVLASVAEVRMVTEPLIRYRLHPAQQIGVPSGKSRLYHHRRRAQLVRRMRKQERTLFREQAEAHRQVIARVHRSRDLYPPRDAALAYLDGKAQHLEMRAGVPAIRGLGRRLAAVAAEASARRYHRFSNGWSSAAKDVLLLDEALNRSEHR